MSIKVSDSHKSHLRPYILRTFLPIILTSYESPNMWQDVEVGNTWYTFHAWIEDYQSRKPLVQVGDKTKDNTATCFVKSVDNKRFNICVSVHNTTQAFACDIYIDGRCVGASLLRDCSYGHDSRLIRFGQIDAGPGQVIPLRFGRTKTCGKELCKFR